MGVINTSDIIFATVTLHGREIAAFRFSGVTTLAEILKQVRNAAIGCVNRVSHVGLVNVNLRNSTQGWSLARSLFLSTTPALSGTM
jgi:hypothetical protein